MVRILHDSIEPISKLMKRITLLISIVILHSVSGHPSGRITFKILEAALVSMPDHITAIAIIDRSLPEDMEASIIEGILTGEGMNQDKLASQMALDGLTSVLQNSAQFRILRTNEVMKRPGVDGNFSDPLNWEQIEELCRKYDVDAILVLEGFDSDFIITHGTTTNKTDENQIFALGFSFYARGLATVNLSFRLYDPTMQAIVDQYHFDHTMSWEVGGGSLDAAIGALMSKDAAIRDASYDAGMAYGQRITPSWFYITREYYKRSKGNEDMAEGARMMEANDWDLAIDALLRAIENGRRKTKGRAAHNLAVVYEILGDLEAAKEWATAAWGKYKNKGSKDYGYILTRRINEQKILDQQL